MENAIVVEEEYGLPDPGHLEMALQGLSDTLDQVEGNESYSLTGAQQYLYTCIGLNGGVSRQDAVVGAEGFFDAVGDGLTKVWEFIKRMFKAITDFFFGGGKAEKKEKAAEETVKKAEEALKDVGKVSGGNAESFDQLATRILAELKAIDGEGKKEAEEAILRLENLTEKEAKAKAAAEIQASLLPRINSRAKEHIKSLTTRGEQAAQAFANKIGEDHSAKFKGTPFAKVYDAYHAKISDSNAKDRGFLTKTAGLIHNLTDAQRALHVLGEILGGYVEDRKTVLQYKSTIEGEIKQIESRLNDAGRTKKVPKELKQDSRTCGEFLKLLNDTSTNLEAAYERIEQMAKAICRLFGIKL